MQSLKKFYFGKQKVKVPNTFIGGIGATINTPALLASRLGIDENRIKLFKVTGVDVECAVIGGSYTMPMDAWSGNATGITYFDDIEGKCTSFQPHPFRTNNNTILRAFFPKCTQILRNAFNSAGVIKVIYMPLLTTIPEQNGVFATVSRPTIYLNPFLATSNAGGEDAQVAQARSLGSIIRYVTNFTPPNPVTNLSTGTIYNTAVQLNFTPPTSLNGVDFYEVYLNGERFSTREIKNSGDFITGLTPSTNYNIRIVAVDMFYNKSELRDTVNVTTTNTVLDVDVNAYMLASNNERWQPVINSLFTDLKSQGLYNKIQAFYPFLGTTSAQHKWNAKNPLDTDAAFRLQFFGGGTHSNLGYQCNGANAYANTFLIPSAVQNLNSNGLTITVGTNNNTIGEAIEIGANSSGTSLSYVIAKLNNSTFKRTASFNQDSTRADQVGINDAKGVFTGSKTSSNLQKLIRNSVVLSTGAGGGTLPSAKVYIGVLNIRDSSRYGHSSQRIQFTAIHDGLTDAEVVALHTIIDNFESAIGRKTW